MADVGHVADGFQVSRINSRIVLAVIMERKETQSSEGETSSSVLVEFLEVAITSILFLKGIYPPGAFERRRYMNLLVHRARHPQLNRYIHDSVNALVPYIKQGVVEKVAVVFFKDDRNPVERFMFKINVKQSYCEMMDLELSLRSLLVKLSVSNFVVSQDWKWEITACFCSLPESDGMWISSNTQQWEQPPLITPIKSINTHPLSVQLYLEHSPPSLEN